MAGPGPNGPTRRTRGCRAVSDKLKRHGVLRAQPCDGAEQPDGAVAVTPSAPPAEPVPLHSGPRLPLRRRALRPRCPGPCLDSAAPVATRAELARPDSITPGEANRRRPAEQSARATYSPITATRSSYPSGVAPSACSPRAPRLDRKAGQRGLVGDEGVPRDHEEIKGPFQRVGGDSLGMQPNASGGSVHFGAGMKT
jgi:hypothetical protein